MRVRVAARWYVLALVTPPLVSAGAVGLVTLAGGPTQMGVTLGLPAALLYLVYGTGLFLLTEEAVWRGVLLPRLQARLAPLPAALVLGRTGWPRTRNSPCALPSPPTSSTV